MQEAQTIYRDTGGTHGVALAAPAGDFFFHAEDVGRHNAMDKVIGRCLMRNRDMTQMVALLSGRISFEMALKAVRAGIPILAAVSAPTSMALELAQELNLTLAGFVRGRRLNVYTHPERIRCSCSLCQPAGFSLQYQAQARRLCHQEERATRRAALLVFAFTDN